MMNANIPSRQVNVLLLCYGHCMHYIITKWLHSDYKHVFISSQSFAQGLLKLSYFHTTTRKKQVWKWVGIFTSLKGKMCVEHFPKTLVYFFLEVPPGIHWNIDNTEGVPRTLPENFGIFLLGSSSGTFLTTSLNGSFTTWTEAISHRLHEHNDQKHT